MKTRLYIFLVFCGVCLFANGQIRQVPDSLVKNFSKRLTAVSAFNAHEVEQEIFKGVADSLATLKNAFLAPLSTLIKEPLTLKNGQLNSSSLYDSAFFASGPYWMNYLALSTDWMIGGMPLKIDYKVGNWPFATNGNFTLSFDREEYLYQLKSKLAQRFDPKTILASVPDPLAALKKSAEQALQYEFKQINEQYKSLLTDRISSLGDLQAFITKDLSSLQQEFSGQTFSALLAEKKLLLNQMQTKLNLGESIDTAAFRHLNNTVLQHEGMQKLYETIEAHKRSWQVSGLLARIKEWEAFKLNKLNEIMNQPSLVARVAKQQLSLNGVQRFFLKISKLKLGQHSLSSSPFSLHHFLNNGAVTELADKGKSAMLFMGKALEGAAILDVPFTRAGIHTTASRGFQLARQGQHGGLNFTTMSFDQGLHTMGNLSGLANFKRSIVTGFRKEFVLGKYSYLNTEVSRSVSTYIGGSSNNEQGNALAKLLSSEDFAANTAFHLSYRDELPNLGLRYQVHIKKAAMGYNNPGNPFLNTGSREGGISLRKGLLQNNVLISLRSDVREFNYGREGHNKWRNIYTVLDIKWKLKKGQFLSIRYLPNRMVRIDSMGKHPSTLYDQLAVDGNLTKRLGKTIYMHYFNLSYQQNRFVINNEWIGAKTLGIIANQTLMVRKLLIHWNSQFNHAVNSSQLVYFNSNFTTEIGTHVNLFGKLNATTSFSYNSAQRWYRQIGFRESLALQLAEQLNVHLFVDVRKNLALYQPLLFGTVRGELGVNYRLK